MTIDDTIIDEKVPYGINREAVKMPAYLQVKLINMISSGK